MSRKQVNQHPRESCYFCGNEGPLESHHIVPKRHNGSDQSANLVDLCPTCHEKLERLYDKRFYAEMKNINLSDESSWQNESSKTQREVYKEVKWAIYDAQKTGHSINATATQIQKQFSDLECISSGDAWDIVKNMKNRGKVVECGNGTYRLVDI